MSVTDGIGQTPCFFEHYLVQFKIQFLADRTNGSAHATVLRLSGACRVSSSVTLRIVAKRCVL